MQEVLTQPLTSEYRIRLKAQNMPQVRQQQESNLQLQEHRSERSKEALKLQ